MNQLPQGLSGPLALSKPKGENPAMKIIDILSQDKVTLSFEVFPPKTSDSYESVAKATQEIAALKPDFMSVTYGAGGGTSDYTVGIAAGIRDKYGVEPLAHLTCASSTREHVHQVLGKLKESGISNVLALRGLSLIHILTLPTSDLV